MESQSERLSATRGRMDILMTKEHKEKIRMCTQTLSKNMQPLPVIEELYSVNIVTDHEREQCKSKPTRTEQVIELMDIMERKADGGFKYLLDALASSSQVHLSDLLEDGVRRRGRYCTCMSCYI